MKKIDPSAIFEFTAKNTAQQIGKLERGIATIWIRTRAMIDGAGIEAELKAKLWCVAFKKCKEEKWSGEMPRHSTGSITFGEVGVVMVA